MRIEICTENEFEEFEHQGYYESINDAIQALYVLKLYEKEEIKCDDDDFCSGDCLNCNDLYCERVGIFYGDEFIKGEKNNDELGSN